MKKRILSFLMACMMVASTIIISKPLVHVHATESEEVTKWTMDPGAFYTGNGTAGCFQIGKLDGSTFTNISGCVGTWNQIDWGEENILDGASADKWIREHAWRAYETFAYDKSEGSTLRVNPISWDGDSTTSHGTLFGVELAVAFTAPADGFYSYKEVVHSLGKNADETGTKQVIFKVKKGTTEHNTTTPDLKEDFNGSLKGLIELAAGDVLYFTANVYGTPTLTDADVAEHYFGAGIDELVIEKLNEEDFKTYEFSSDLTGAVCGTDNAFTLRGYNHVTGEFLDDLTYENNEAYVTGITSNTSKFFWSYKDRVCMLPLNAGHDYSSVIQFTAPKAGEYFFDAQFYKEWEYNGRRFSNDFLIVNSDMEVLNRSTTYDLLAETNAAGELQKRHGVTCYVRHSVYLNKGESVYFMTRVNENAITLNQNYTSAGIVSFNVIRGSVHPCSAETLTKVPYAAPDCVTAGNEEHWKCSCGEIYADAEATTVYEGEIEIPVDEDAHAPATEWTTDEVGHWYVCNNGCDEKLSYGEHDWTNGVCGTCELACPAHDMKNAEGKCATCGMTHEHVWTDGVCDTCGYECQHTGGTATCANQAQCTACGSYYGDVDKTNHEQEGYWIDNGDGTCYFYYPCCYAPTVDPDEFEAALQPHEYDDDADMTCNHCGYDRTVVVAEDNFGEVFESVFTEGATTDHVAQGPAEGALNNSGAVKGEAVTGFTYRGFNLEMISSTSNIVKLRHHILLADGLTVKVDGEAVALENVSGNYYYFEVEVEVGQFGTAHVITVEGTTVVTASVHSYMKTAFESGTLTAEQTNLLNALYDWDYAVANAN